jgi:hypothetical protein
MSGASEFIATIEVMAMGGDAQLRCAAHRKCLMILRVNKEAASGGGSCRRPRLPPSARAMRKAGELYNDQHAREPITE